MATAARHAQQAPTRPAPARPQGSAAPPNETQAQRHARIVREQNIRQLATVMYREARSEGTAAMTAVGFTLRNRLARSSEQNISGVWGGYSHGAVPSGLQQGDAKAWVSAQQIARDIIDGKISDPTQGATHFYTPNKMPYEGGIIPPNVDVKGGLEDVPGSESGSDNLHRRTYRPGFSVVYPQTIVPGLTDPVFKFYKAPNDVTFGRKPPVRRP